MGGYIKKKRKKESCFKEKLQILEVKYIIKVKNSTDELNNILCSMEE